MTESLRVGDRLRDNHRAPPCSPRVLTVREINATHARLSDGNWASLRRIHLDDKPRRSGWSRV